MARISNERIFASKDLREPFDKEKLSAVAQILGFLIAAQSDRIEPSEEVNVEQWTCLVMLHLINNFSDIHSYKINVLKILLKKINKPLWLSDLVFSTGVYKTSALSQAKYYGCIYINST